MTKKIASIHFDEVELDRSQYGGFFRIPAVAKGADPEIIQITDHTQLWQTVQSMGKQTRRETILGEEIARDCIRHWTMDRIGVGPTCHPGIWIVRDEIPLYKEITREDGEKELRPMTDADQKQQFRPATPEEYARMFAEDLQAALLADANWAEYLDTKAMEWWTDTNTKSRTFIGDHHRKAARHYGRVREYLRNTVENDAKVCMFCAKMIPTVAVVCPQCNQIVDAVGYNRLKAEAKQAVDAIRLEDSPHKCSDCGKSFLNAKELAQHRVHQKDCNATAYPKSA